MLLDFYLPLHALDCICSERKQLKLWLQMINTKLRFKGCFFFLIITLEATNRGGHTGLLGIATKPFVNCEEMKLC